MRNGQAWILWRQWRDGSIVAAPCHTLTQLNKQIERDKAKAVRMWKQPEAFDPEACIEIEQDLVSKTA